jgi:general secretion pathway protein D
VIRIGDQVTLQASPPIQQFRFGNRSAETTLNMRDGETIVLGGLIQEEDRRTRVTMPWIGDLPVIGNLLSSYKTERVTTEVILTITPRIIQSAPATGRNQAFWSGTEFSYATSPLFSNSTKQAAPLGDYDPTLRAVPSANGVGRKTHDGAPAARSLADRGAPGPLLAVKPEETAVQAGKEMKLAIIDGRLRATDHNLFRLEYDPKVLQFKRFNDGALISPAPGEDSPDGIIAFRLARPFQHAPRSVSVTFIGKAPGVSPVRVEVAKPDGGMAESSSEMGKGIVRVR